MTPEVLTFTSGVVGKDDDEVVAGGENVEVITSSVVAVSVVNSGEDVVEIELVEVVASGVVDRGEVVGSKEAQ